MNSKERRAAFNKARTAQRKRLRGLTDELYNEIVTLLELAEEKIQAVLLAQPTDYKRWQYSMIQSQINQALMDWGQRSQSQIDAYAKTTWQAGIDLLDEPLKVAGVSISAIAPVIHPVHLTNIQHFMGERLKNVATTVGAEINKHLGLTTVGAQDITTTINKVQTLLGDTAPRWRAKTIVKTELGGLYSRSTQERMTQASDALPGLQKEWRRSNKRSPRANHVAANGQRRAVDQPFDVGTVKMMHPHDKKAPAKEIINCGCDSLPYMSSWDVNPPALKADSPF